MSFPFVIPLMVISMKKSFTIEEAVVTDKGVIPYKVYQHNPIGNKLRYTKCIKYRNMYFTFTPWNVSMNTLFYYSK